MFTTTNTTSHSRLLDIIARHRKSRFNQLAFVIAVVGVTALTVIGLQL
jgi:hypothetical protein